MRKIIKETTLLKIIIALLLSLLFIFILTPKDQTINLNGYQIENKPIFQGDILDFVIISQRFAKNHEYTESYKCRNYTEDLARIMQELGLKAEKVEGCNINKTECHAWIRLKVDFEPQRAEFIDYSAKYPLEIK